MSARGAVALVLALLVTPAIAQPARQPAPAPASTVTPAELARASLSKLNELRAAAAVLAEEGSPAQRVTGKLTLYEVEREIKRREMAQAEAKAQEELRKQLAIIERTPASPEAKSRARIMAQLGAKPSEILKALQLDGKGEARRRERAEKAAKLLVELEADAIGIRAMEAAAQRALELIDNGWWTTGTLGVAMRHVPGSDARRLDIELTKLRTAVANDKFAELRANGAMSSTPLSNEVWKWLEISQGNLDQSQEPRTLKRNINMMLATKRILRELRGLGWLVAEGDKAALARYAQLTEQLGKLYLVAGGN
jgi:hypothetical protein